MPQIVCTKCLVYLTDDNVGDFHMCKECAWGAKSEDGFEEDYSPLARGATSVAIAIPGHRLKAGQFSSLSFREKRGTLRLQGKRFEVSEE